MTDQSVEQRLSALEARLGDRTLEEHFREQAGSIDRRLADSRRELSELLERRLAEGFEKQAEQIDRLLRRHL
jgi:hypothetical protein